ncbi:ATP-binding protein [Bacillus fonticola]|uniref:ATP-binding protein n=1 Tax=Bacillus fonticola TaxID=2728853 RepID=UPI001474B953|nr:ATP-binding protein [Bacillus fonticola]
MTLSSCVQIQTEEDIVHARHIGREHAKELGFSSVEQSRIASTISELARNIVLYAKEGEICIEALEHEGKKGLAISAKDAGPGIDDLRLVMEEGYSTSGGLGSGLSGVKRIVDEFTIRSEVGNGTIIETKKWLA